MDSIWIFGPLAVAALGLIFFIAGAGHLFHGRAVRAGVGLTGGGAATIAGLAAGLLGLNLQSYSRLTYEAPVAEVSVHALDVTNKQYAVTVKRLDSSLPPQTCQLQGDDWLLAGRVQKWQPWANEIGLNATYTLNLLSNMYETAESANGRPITACNIKGPPPKINQYLPQSWIDWLISHALVQDRRFGSANFMPLADGAVYKVVITQMGFNAEPANDAAAKANDSRP